MAYYKDILIYGEVDDGKISPITLELLGIGRKLADARKEQLSIILIGRDIDQFGSKAIAHGADKVYIVEDAPIDDYEGASYTAIMGNLCKETIKPAIVLLGQTLTGRDLAPRLAFRLESGLVTDCVGLSIDPDSKQLLATKPVAGGNVLATYLIKEDVPQLATVRCKAMEPSAHDESRKGDVLRLSAGISESAVRVKVVRRVKEESQGPNLETATIIVSGGRGIGAPEDFEKYIKQGLAKVLGAAVGGTRAAVDFGLISEQHQVGLTGKIVGPNLYFAVALSGAIQHITGCAGSKNIVAINKDANAQIFRFARFGIVGDYKKILPKLTEQLTFNEGG